MASTDFYEPAEDSFLLAKQLPKKVKGSVLDMGTGSGIQAETAAKSKNVKSVLAVDINSQALKYVKNLDRNSKENQYRKKITVLKSDLFSKLGNKKFDTIIFNPPYLPAMSGEKKDILTKSIVGGKHGWEIIERFMSEVSNYITPDGKIFLLFSSETNKDKVLDIISSNLFDANQIASQKLFYETLYVYEISKSKLWNDLNKKGLKNIHAFAKGKRGLVYIADYKNKKVAVKVQIEKGSNRIENEVKWLKILNKHKIGPSFILKDKNYFVMDFIEGQSIWEFMRDNEKTEIKKVIKQIFDQCYIIDELGINKLEMHHPHKHIIITKDKKAVLIDFERVKQSTEPKNVTQFVQFMTSTSFQISIMGKNFWMNKERLRRLAQFYKNNPNERSLEKIFKEIR